MTLVRIVAPHFVAGVIATNGRVTRTAPILGYMLGWDGRRVATYAKAKGWSWSVPDDGLIASFPHEAEEA